MDLAQAAALADEYATARRPSASSRRSAASGTTRSRRPRAIPTTACARVAYRALAQFRFRQKLELLRRGLEDESPAVRGSALIALEGLSRAHPGRRQRVPAAPARARRARSERRRAPARDRLLQERHAGARDDPAPRRDRGQRRDRRRGAQDRALGGAVARQEVAREAGDGGAPLVGLIMGSRSDWETMRHAAETLDALGVPYEQRVVSAHRTPDLLFEYAASAEERGLQVIIAGAGGAAHLPGMAAAKTALPVLGVPVESKTLKGMDSLLSIVQMPAGVPVGTLAIGRAGRGQRRAARGGDPRALRRRHPRAARRVPRRADAVRARRARPRRVTVGVRRSRDARRLHRRRAARTDARARRAAARAPRFRFLDPSPDAPAARGGRARRRRLRRRRRPRRARRGSRRRHLRVRERARRAPRARVGAAAAAARARARPGPAGREGALPPARDPDGAVRLARRHRAARAREVAAARLRRQGTAAASSAEEPARRRRARRGGRRLRPRAVGPRRAGARRRDALLAARRERAPRRHPPRLARAGARAPQAEAEELAARLLDELDYVGVLALELFEVGGRLLANEFAPRVHNTGHWTIDGAVDEPVREPPARDPRPAARRHGRACARR